MKKACKSLSENSQQRKFKVTFLLDNEDQIITGYPIDGAMGSSGGGRVRKLLVVCLHNNVIVARGILVTTLHCRTPEVRFTKVCTNDFCSTNLLSPC